MTTHLLPPPPFENLLRHHDWWKPRVATRAKRPHGGRPNPCLSARSEDGDYTAKPTGFWGRIEISKERRRTKKNARERLVSAVDAGLLPLDTDLTQAGIEKIIGIRFQAVVMLALQLTVAKSPYSLVDASTGKCRIERRDSATH